MDYMVLNGIAYDRRQFYRQGHDVEITCPGPEADIRSHDRDYRGNSSGTARDKNVSSIPEVFNACNSHVTALSPGWVDLVCDCNYELPREQALKIFADDWAFNNGRPTPGFDKSRWCGGAILFGYPDSTYLFIETLRTSGAIPTAAYVLARPWLWYYGMAVDPDGHLSYMTLSNGQGKRIPVKIPLITEEQIFVPLRWLHKIPVSDPLPDSFWLS